MMHDNFGRGAGKWDNIRGMVFSLKAERSKYEIWRAGVSS